MFKGLMKKSLIFGLLVLIADTSFAYKSIEFHGVQNREVIREDTLRQEAKFGDYEIKIYRDWDIGTDGVVQIFKGDELIFEEQDHSYSLGTSDGDTDLDDSPQIGQDITGDGDPDLVFSHWSAGAHCCYDVYIFSIGKEFKIIDKIEGEHGFVGFKDLDGDRVQEFIGYDWAFAYWNASFAGSPAPEIILRYKNGTYTLAYDLMKKPLLEIKSFDEIKIRDEELIKNQCEMGNAWNMNGYCIQSDVWGHMLDLIYGGYPEEAWNFLDDYWKSDEETKNAFLSDFKQQLALSDYSNGLPVDLAGYKPDIEDEAVKKELRFLVYYEKMLKTMDSIKKEQSLPTINSIKDEEKIKHAIRGWSGQ